MLHILTENLRILTPWTVAALHGEDALNGITLSHAENDETMELPVQAVFAAMGRIPDCTLLQGLADLDAQGYVQADENCCTKTPGLYVAGDCRAKHIRQLTTAVADGTAAAMAACEYLNA